MARGALWAIGIVIFMTACVGRGVEPRKPKTPPEVTAPSGTQIPVLALAFEVSYDRETDGVIPYYRILNVGITNNSLEILHLDPLGDQWWVVDRAGKRHHAIVNLRRTDPDRWANLPIGLKKLLEYPLLVPIGSTQPIDLLFADRINLNEFREVVFQSIGLDRIIRIYARE
ncbi:MAG: hypothetical protein HYV03_07720 [Deltaproteobacteria bacterium]|nr:hypothetical protein [Deltaproteobacteria bacterium]